MRTLRVDPGILDLMRGVEVDRAPTTEAMAAQIEALPEPYRSVIDAIFWEQVPRRALAKRLGVRRSVVERLYREALELLRAPAPRGES